MALSSAFHERIEQMDRTRTQRLSLLQVTQPLTLSTLACFPTNMNIYMKSKFKTMSFCSVISFAHTTLNSEHQSLRSTSSFCTLQAEKELQAHKSRILASKLANIRSVEQRCSLLHRKIASQDFNILSLKSQIENLEAKYESVSQEFRYI